MKKLFLIAILFIYSQVSFAAFGYASYTVNAGGTITVSPSQLAAVTVLYSDLSPLAANFTLELSSQPTNGTVYTVWLNLHGLDISTHDITVFGVPLQPIQTTNTWGVFTFIQTADGQLENYTPRFDGTNFGYDAPIEGDEIAAGTLPLDRFAQDIPLSIMDTVGRGRILLGNSTNALSSYYAAGSGKILVGDGSDLKTVSVSGDISLTTTGVTYIDSATIRDSSIATGAAIKWQKLATGTASYVAVTNASGVLTTEQYLQPIRGGTGINTNASTGFATVSAGTWSVGSLTDVRDLHVSFAASSQGTYYITFPVAVTVTNIEARVETALAATDSATLQIQNDAGTNMTGDNLTSGLLVMAASATTGTGYTSTLTTNNTFTAGQRMRIITNKGTAGGTANIQVTYTRNN